MTRGPLRLPRHRIRAGFNTALVGDELRIGRFATTKHPLRRRSIPLAEVDAVGTCPVGVHRRHIPWGSNTPAAWVRHSGSWDRVVIPATGARAEAFADALAARCGVDEHTFRSPSSP